MKQMVFVMTMLVIAYAITAQDYKKKSKSPAHLPVSDSVSISDTDIAGTYHIATDSSTDKHYFLFPDFYSYWPVYNNDTILRYDCFDIDHRLILTDTLSNVNDIQFITVTRTYNDYLKTYIDPDGKPRPQPVSRVVNTFERTGNETWKSTNLASGNVVLLQEHKTEIIRKDTTIVADALTGNKQQTIRQYYRVTEIDGSETAVAPPMTSDDNAGTEIKYYTVPEFYFHWPKKSRDTTFIFECYDDRDSLIPIVEDYDSVRYFSLLKKFMDSTHTYRYDDGTKKPLPVSLIVTRYDHSGKDKWISVEYPGNKFTELRAFKDLIVSVDTEVVADPLSGHEQMKIFRHYKIIKN